MGTAGLRKILQIFAASMRVLQMLQLILENSPFPCVIAFLLQNNLLKINNFSSFFNSFN